MELFNEQVVSIKKTTKNKVIIVLIWVMAVVLSLIALFLATKFPPALLVSAAIIYLANKTATQFNIEFEYISSNGSVEIAKITNKSSRKTVVEFECKEVENVTKYNKDSTYKNKLLICTDQFENSYVFTVYKNGEKCDLVFSPNEKLLNSFKHYIPRSVIEKR